MAEWLTVGLLLTFGLALLVLEVIFIPGTTIVGIMGCLSMGYGIYMSYNYFGAIIGTCTLGISLFASIAAFYYSFHSGVWERFSLQKTIDSKVNDQERQLTIGEVGVAVSTIKSIGEVDFDDELREVHSIDGNWIDSGKKVKIVQIKGTKVFVEELSE